MVVGGEYVKYASAVACLRLFRTPPGLAPPSRSRFLPLVFQPRTPLSAPPAALATAPAAAPSLRPAPVGISLCSCAAAASLAKDVSTFGAAFADEFGSQVQLGWTRHTERKYAAHARVVANPPPPRTPLWQRVLVGPSALDHGESWQKRLYASSYPRLALATPVGEWWTRARVDALATALHGKTTSVTALVDSFVEAQFADAPSKCTAKEKAADAAAVAAAKRAARRDAKWAACTLVSWRSREVLGVQPVQVCSMLPRCIQHSSTLFSAVLLMAAVEQASSNN